MSHTSHVSGIEITDINALRAAIVDLNAAGVDCALLENATPRSYFSNQEGLGQAEFVLKLNNARYDVGLYKEGTSYRARVDLYGGSVAKQLGIKNAKTDQEKIGKLYQHYSAAAVQRSLSLKGISSTRKIKDDESIQILAMVS